MKKISVAILVIVQVVLTLLICGGAVLLLKTVGVRVHQGSDNRLRVRAVVAATDLQAQTRLTAEQVETVKVPVRGLPPNYLTHSSQVVGRRVKLQADVMKGQLLTADLITREETVVDLLHPGMRAFGLTFSPNDVSVTLVRPGSLVDVHVTLPIEDKEIGEALVIAPLVQQLRILAVDGETVFTQGRPTAAAQRTPSDSDNLKVLLEVNDEQASVLQLTQKGRLSLVLRNPTDRTFRPVQFVQPMILTQGWIEPFGELYSPGDLRFLHRHDPPVLEDRL
jgi:Flp pilus assembly protein CpaB